MRFVGFVALVMLCLPAAFAGPVRVGHDPNIMPAVNRYTGIVTALGKPDAEGRIFTIQAKPIGPKSEPRTENDLRGWRLTMLAGERFSGAFEVKSNTASEITVMPVDGPLNGVAVNDVFVVEQIEMVRDSSPAAAVPAK